MHGCLLLLLFSFSDVDKLVNQLDHSSFQVRTEATAKLANYSYEAIPFIESKLKTSLSKEQRNRLVSLHSSIFKTSDSGALEIWFLPAEKRFVDGVDIATKYYSIVRERHNDFNLDSPVDDWSDHYVAVAASQMYFRELSLAGEEIQVSILKEVMRDLKDQLKAVALDKFGHSSETVLHAFLFGQKPLPPIEVIIKNPEEYTPMFCVTQLSWTVIGLCFKK